MSNLLFLKDQPGYHAQPASVAAPATPAPTGMITARIDDAPRLGKIMVQLDANRILFKCAYQPESRWIAARDIIAPCERGLV